MANIIFPDNPQWRDVPLLEETTLVLGGIDGPDNWQAKAIGERTEWLKKDLIRVEALIESGGETPGGGEEPGGGEPGTPAGPTFGDIAISYPGDFVPVKFAVSVLLTRKWTFPAGFVGSFAATQNTRNSGGPTRVEIGVWSVSDGWETIGYVTFHINDSRGEITSVLQQPMVLNAGDELTFYKESSQQEEGGILRGIAITLTGTIG